MLGQQLGQVAVIDAGIAAARQLHDLVAPSVRQAARTGPAAVGVNQGRRSVALEPNFESPHVALAQLHQRRRLGDGQTDKLSEQLAVTKLWSINNSGAAG